MTDKILSEFEKTSIRRKELQASGEAPDWYTTQSLLMFERKYAYQGETPKGAFQRVAKTLSKHYYTDPELAYNKFFNLMWKGFLAPSTPVLCNAGTGRGLVVSCAGNYLGDSISEFYQGHSENAMLTKLGFGTSSYLGSIRPRGASISTGSKANGVVPVFDSAIDVMQKVSQGGRRGQWAGYLEVDHGDFWELCGYIQKNPATANVGWIFTDAFIERLNSGDQEAIARWNKVLYLRARTGKGYIFKDGVVNRNTTDAIKNSGIAIKASNLCVAPETRILTDKGHVEIKTLEDKTVNVWNGEEFSEVVVRKTGEDQELMKVTTTSGEELICTPEHKFYVYPKHCATTMKIQARMLEKGDSLINWKTPEGASVGTQIASVEFLDRTDDTYCFTEHKRGMGVFNGILTGQCEEIKLPSNEDYTFSCVLSSLNLAFWDQFEEDTIYWSLIFLDCVAEEALEGMSKHLELKKIYDFTKDFRALGLGVIGLHTLFQKKMLPFEGFEAHMLNTEIFKTIQEESKRASKDLAKVDGEPLQCKGTGMRHATLNCCPPTMSSALLCGAVSNGIEPEVGMAFNQGSAAGEMTRVNPQFSKLAKERGMFSEELMKEIAMDHQGSVQHLDWLSEEEKLVFKTAFEIDQRAILRLASQRQKFIDQGQSLNLFFSAEEDEEYIAEIHKEALLDESIKGLYYLRSSRGVEASKGECVACEG